MQGFAPYVSSDRENESQDAEHKGKDNAEATCHPGTMLALALLQMN